MGTPDLYVGKIIDLAHRAGWVVGAPDLTSTGEDKGGGGKQFVINPCNSHLCLSVMTLL